MITQSRLKELIKYNPKTGIFTWIIGRSGTNGAGNIAGGICPRGYRRIKIDGKGYQASRLAWLYMEGYLPEHYIDHINRICSDDRWFNLRHVTCSCNIKNTNIMSHNTSGIKGVSWCKRTKLWQSRITSNGNRFHLGRYKDFDDAVCARLAGEQCLDWHKCDAETTAYKYIKNMLEY